jgi:type VI protein secretion system component Hcp
MTGRLRVESLEDRFNLSTLDPFGAAAPVSVIAEVRIVADAPAARSERQDYFKITMEDVLVSSYSISGSDPGLVSPPTDPEPAQVDYFLRLKGIDGEVTSATDDIWVDGRVITGQDYDSATVQGTHSSQGGGGAGKVQMQDTIFVARSTPKMLLTSADGKHAEPESPGDYTDSSDGAEISIPIKVKHNL